MRTARVLDIRRVETCGVVSQVEFHQRLPSTNDRAVELAARDDIALPLLVIAEEQIAGRGRGANRWWSAPGALTFSMLLDAAAMNLSPAQWPQLSLAAGLAVCEALEQSLPQQLWGVKWPNDVFASGRKVCGILMESPSARRGRVVVGIGINVNNSFAEAPTEIRSRATSMSELAGHQLCATGVLVQVLAAFDRRWKMLAALGFGALLEDWRRYCILDGKTVTLVQGQEAVAGLCQGIDESGALLVQTQAELKRCVAGTIERFE